MFFDTNEIHIQAFVDLLMENESFSVPHLHKIILKIYIQKSRYRKYIQKINSKQNEGLPFESFRKCRLSDMGK